MIWHPAEPACQRPVKIFKDLHHPDLQTSKRNIVHHPPLQEEISPVIFNWVCFGHRETRGHPPGHQIHALPAHGAHRAFGSGTERNGRGGKTSSAGKLEGNAEVVVLVAMFQVLSFVSSWADTLIFLRCAVVCFLDVLFFW